MGDNDIQQIKALADCRTIFRRFWPEYYREKGNFACPFHEDSTPSLQVDKDLAYCHAEGKRWDAIDLYAAGTKTELKQAIQLLAEELRIRNGNSGGQATKTGLSIDGIFRHRRGIRSDTFELIRPRLELLPGKKGKYHPSFAIPVTTWDGKPLGKQFFPLDGGDKKFSKGTPAKEAFIRLEGSGPTVIVEGFWDAASVKDALPHADVAAILSANFTSKLASIPGEPILFLDNDEAGRKGTAEAVKVLKGRCRVVDWSPNAKFKDPNDIIKYPDGDHIITRLIRDAVLPEHVHGADGLDDEKTDCQLCSEDGKLRKHKKAALALKPHLGDLLYDGLTQRWMGYDGDVWKPLTIHQAAGIVDRLITELAPDIDYNTSWRDGVMSQLSLYLCWDDSNAPKDAIPFRNGVLFLDDMRFEKHRKEFCFTWQLPYNYNIFATCQPVQQWLLETTGDQQQVELLRAYLNAILTGRADLHRYLELVGPGGTGKGTFIRLAEAVIGKENVHVSELKHLENNRFETSKLYGKRLCTITDAEKYSGDVATLKAITGGDSIRYEEKHKQNGAPFRYQGMVLIAANQDMGSSDYTSGLQRRRITVRFEKVVPPEKRRDLESEFEPYLPGAINWVLSMPRERVTALLRDTDQHVKTLRGASKQTLINTNPVADWANDCLVYSSGLSTFIGRKVTDLAGRIENADEKLYPCFCQWCEETGHKPFALNRFVSLLKDLLCNQLRLTGVEHKAGRDGKQFLGIGIRKASTAELPSPLAAFFGEDASTMVGVCDAPVTSGDEW